MADLTTKTIESLRGTGKRKSQKVPGGGSLVVRGLKVITYSYVFVNNSQRLTYVFGTHSRDGDSTGSDSTKVYTLTGAKRRAQSLAALHEKVGDIGAHFRAERETAERERQRLDAEQLATEQDAVAYSLARLCQAYTDNLELTGKSSAREADRVLNRWVIEKHPEIAAKKASEVITADVVLMLRAVIAAGKTRTVNKVRSYLMAAYNYGIGSATDLLASTDSTGFNLTDNPVSRIKQVAKFEQAGQRHLNKSELAELLRRLVASPKREAKAALLCTRLGGQRVRQLLTVTAESYNPDTQLVTLIDRKGRGSKPRNHLLPVPEQALPLLLDALKDPHPQRPRLWRGLDETTVSRFISGLSKTMTEECDIPSFTMRDIRRTCETMAASMGVHKDIRGHVQSHGIGGVQDKHYDKHDYLPEKEAVLIAWNARLDELISGKPANNNVVAIGAQS